MRAGLGQIIPCVLNSCLLRKPFIQRTDPFMIMSFFSLILAEDFFPGFYAAAFCPIDSEEQREAHSYHDAGW
jgi:hypothetical protein